ncbi:hypothetical protein [Sphingobacterium corticibacter]|uniref:Uncharacterized protein n=1 Tax=Sphingobacterium corticibacter TaxID=2171749 RepID=A0A2T8HNF8_9SPHI|nr:hypothetical protein [Sphingobacterium corticibacter]PVH26984.1 hypothetical protein DC487_05155 [Sphingobacterium corticibacter]
MKVLLSHIKKSIFAFFNTAFASDMDVISNEAKKSLSNYHDRRELAEAISRMRELELEGKKPETSFTLKNGEKVTLVR